jgi:hypothetical protein
MNNQSRFDFPRTCSAVRRRFRPYVELLEDRCLLTNHVVSLTTDTTVNSSPGELRTAINTSAAGDTISFAPVLNGQTIQLSALGTLSIPAGLTLVIDASSLASGVTVRGTNAYSIFTVNLGASGTLIGLTITNGSGTGGGISNLGSLTVRGSVITGNTTGGTGGGIYNHGSMYVGGCVISNNHAQDGGGLYGNGASYGLTVVASTISNNTATRLGGGAAGAQGMILRQCLITGNTAALRGGGSYGGKVYSCTFTANSAPLGGGAAEGALYTCTLTGNTGTTGGGGAYKRFGSGRLTQCTIVGNMAGAAGGGGLYVGISPNRVTMIDCIIAGNTTTSPSGSQDVSGPIATAQSDLIGDGTGSMGLSNGVNGNIVGSAGSPVNPLLGPLQNNGGPTQTFLPMPGSPALGAGSPALSLDQRGLPRPNAGPSDIGSVEVTPPGSTTALVSSANPSALSQTVTFTATVTILTSASLTVSGSVTFFIDGKAVATVPFSGSPLSFTTSTLTVGAHTVGASYSGFDSGPVVINGSFSTALTQTVQAPPTPPTVSYFAVGADAGGGPAVSVYNGATGASIASLNAFAPGFTGGVRVAVADVNGDGTPDIICAAGPGGGPEVRVFDGKTFQMIRDFFALPATFTGGVFVAAGDVNGDGYADIVTSADAGGGPEVMIWSGKDGTNLAGFYATAPTFTGGIRVACADLSGNGFAEVIATAGPGGGPQVTIFDGKSLSLLTAFYALMPTFTGGLYVAAGDVNGDGRADIIVGAGAGAQPEVLAYNGQNQTLLFSFFALPVTFTGGVRVGYERTSVSGRPAILTGAGPGGGPQVAPFDPSSLMSLGAFFALPPGFLGGVFVSGN